MPTHLPHVDPHRPVGRGRRAYAASVATRPERFLSAHVVWKLDPLLLRLTRGRLGFGLWLPTALLETTGARSGRARRHPVIYFHDGPRPTIVASRQGDPRHPDWFHNLVADPDVTLGGVPFRAIMITDDAELRRLWPLADQVFAPYATYRRRAAESGRTIPVVQLVER